MFAWAFSKSFRGERKFSHIKWSQTEKVEEMKKERGRANVCASNKLDDKLISTLDGSSWFLSDWSRSWWWGPGGLRSWWWGPGGGLWSWSPCGLCWWWVRRWALGSTLGRSDARSSLSVREWLWCREVGCSLRKKKFKLKSGAPWSYASREKKSFRTHERTFKAQRDENTGSHLPYNQPWRLFLAELHSW